MLAVQSFRSPRVCRCLFPGKNYPALFLQKIDKALKKLDEGVFGICEDCEEPIGIKRLEARPETELCIRCKEDQERTERDFA